MNSEQPFEASKLKPNPLNPRTITDEQLAALKAAMIEFGDLSGLVHNLTTGNLVGGHQRLKVLGNAPVTVLNRNAAPTRQGTVAEGYVTYEGERFVYREVQWSPDKEKAAMIAANKHGGDWDIPGLSALLVELDAADFDMQLTGFSAAELEQLVSSIDDTTGKELVPLSPSEIDALPAHVRMVQLFLSTDTLPPFMEKVRALGETFDTKNITDTVARAVESCYESHYGNIQPGNGVGLSVAEQQAAAGGAPGQSGAD
jgi:hypothetical protein